MRAAWRISFLLTKIQIRFLRSYKKREKLHWTVEIEARFPGSCKSGRWFTRPIVFIANSVKRSEGSRTFYDRERGEKRINSLFLNPVSSKRDERRWKFDFRPRKTCLRALLDGPVKAECGRKIYFDHRGGWIVTSSPFSLLSKHNFFLRPSYERKKEIDRSSKCDLVKKSVNFCDNSFTRWITV